MSVEVNVMLSARLKDIVVVLVLWTVVCLSVTYLLVLVILAVLAAAHARLILTLESYRPLVHLTEKAMGKLAKLEFLTILMKAPDASYWQEIGSRKKIDDSDRQACTLR